MSISNTKKRFSALLAVIMLLSLLPITALAATPAEAAATLANTLNTEFLKTTYGGDGKSTRALTATANDATVTITGGSENKNAVITVPLVMHIPAGVVVDWKAHVFDEYGGVVGLLGAGTFNLTDGRLTSGSLKSNGGPAISNNGYCAINISGGRIYTETQAIVSNTAAPVTISGEAFVDGGSEYLGTSTIEMISNPENVKNENDLPQLTISGNAKVIGSASQHVINTNGSVTVEGNAKVEATGTATDEKAAIYVSTSGHAFPVDVKLLGNAQVKSTGRAVKLEGSLKDSSGTFLTVGNLPTDTVTVTAGGSATAVSVAESGSVTVNGGSITATDGIAVYCVDAVTVNGGTISSNKGAAIRAGAAVTMSGGVVRSGGAIAIDASGPTAEATISGGLAFACSATPFAFGVSKEPDPAVVQVYSTTDNTEWAPTATGTVIAWDEAQGTTQYNVNTETDISKLPQAATATWSVQNSKGGIAYSNGANEGFLPLENITVALQTISSASITGIVAPVKGEAPINEAALATKDTSYTISGLSWGEDAVIAFKPHTVYTATVTLTAATGHSFQSNSLPKITLDEGEASNLAVQNSGDEGNTLTFDIVFPATEKAALTGTPTIDKASPKFGDTLTAVTTDLAADTTGEVNSLAYMWKNSDGDTVLGSGATYTVQESDIGKTITVTATAGNCTGSQTSAATDAVAKADGPAAPTSVTGSYTGDGTNFTYTVNPITGAEYSKDGTSWQDSNEFGGFTIDTPATTFYARLKETTTHKVGTAGNTNAVTFTKLDGRTAPALDYTVSADRITITITTVVGAEYSFDGGTTWGTTNSKNDFIGTETVALQIRLAENATHIAGPASTASVNLAKEDQAAPAEPSLSYDYDSVTNKYTVTIAAIENAQYSFDGSTYNDTRTKTANPGETVVAYVRYAETDTHNASPAASKSLTLPQPVTSITVTGAGSASTITTKGGTLQMQATVLPAGASQEITWSISSGSGGSVSASGLLTATGNGTVTVRATAKDGTGVYGECAITISGQGGGGNNTGGNTTGGGTTTTTPSDKITAPTTEAGWTDAAKKVNDLKDGSEFTVDMKNSTTVSGDFLEAVAGKDVEVSFDMGGGMSWTVNGKDIPKGVDLAALNLAVSTGTTFVPAEVRNIDGSIGEVQLRLSHNGELPFPMTLSVKLDKVNAGNFANLYYYNPETSELEFQSAVKIGADGTTEFDFDHASDYLIVVAETSLAPEPETPWQNPFTDVKASDWFYGDVQYAVENGLFAGTSATTFSPNTPMTRAMLVTVLGRMAGIDAAEYAVPSFDDTPAGAYYTPYVSWAAQNNIVAGYNEGSFGPDDNVTREQFATILYRYAKFKGLDVSVGEETNILSYNDAMDVSEYAVAAMQWACGDGVITGKPGGLLDPKGSATRAEAAAMLHRFLEK